MKVRVDQFMRRVEAAYVQQTALFNGEVITESPNCGKSFERDTVRMLFRIHVGEQVRGGILEIPRTADISGLDAKDVADQIVAQVSTPSFTHLEGCNYEPLTLKGQA